MKIIKNGKLVTVTRAELTSGKLGQPPVDAFVQPELSKEEKEDDMILSSESEGEDVSKYEGQTIAQLKKLLDDKEVEYAKSAKKADLVELCDEFIVEEEEDSESAI